MYTRLSFYASPCTHVCPPDSLRSRLFKVSVDPTKVLKGPYLGKVVVDPTKVLKGPYLGKIYHRFGVAAIGGNIY